jgi:glycosyltransferase involved in cell wall biosynthesis
MGIATSQTFHKVGQGPAIMAEAYGTEKVLFLSYYFPPVGGSGVQRAHKFARYLPEEGYLPIVFAGPSNRKDPWAQIDPTLSEGIHSGVTVHRVDINPVITNNRLREKLSRWIAWPDPFSQWWVKSAFDLASKVKTDARLIFATMSPFENATVAAELSRCLNIPWVADLRDPWALDDIQIYPSFLHRKRDMARMAKSLSTASLIIMNTPEAAKVLKEKIPCLRSTRVISITNGYDHEDFQVQVRPRTDSKFRIVHSGTMYTASGLQLRRRIFYRIFGGVERGVDIVTRSPIFLLEAVSRWSKKMPNVLEDLELVFVGASSSDDLVVANSSKIHRYVHFTGFLSHSESLQFVRTADLLFLPMHNLPPGSRCRSIPGKTFEYMASGRPILAAVPDGDARDFLSQCGTALLCRPDDVEGMVLQLDKAYNDWKSARQFGSMNKDFVAQFERRKLTHDLAQAFNDLLQPS